MASNNTELEVKFKIDFDVYQKIKTKVMRMSIISSTLSNHTDKYYSPNNREYIKDKYPYRWLSIRSRNGKHVLNFKHFFPEGEERHEYCKEYNIDVRDDKQIHILLEALGFQELITVSKKRENYNINNVFDVAFDFIEELGYFIEIEALKDFGDITETRNRIMDLANHLGLEVTQIDHRGYPFQLMKYYHLI
jgi:predicted adenylyl cyclase CyaB